MNLSHGRISKLSITDSESFPRGNGRRQRKNFQTYSSARQWLVCTDRGPGELKEHDPSTGECDAIGRDLSEIEITCMAGHGGEEFLGELEAVGVGRVVIPMMGQGDPVERLTTIAEEVIKP